MCTRLWLAAAATACTNLPPTVEITLPADGAVFTPGALIDLAGSATDLNEPDGVLTDEQLVWCSDVDGQLGLGAALQVQLSPGPHEISLLGADSAGDYDESVVQIEVGDRTTSVPPPVDDVPPEVQILGPRDGSFFCTTYTVQGQYAYAVVDVFSLSQDDVDGRLDGASVQWTTDRADLQDALLAEGENASVALYADLSTQTGTTHLLTVSATDAAGNVGSASITLTVDWLCIL